MRKTLVLTDAAKNDLRGIRRYIAQDSPQQALTFVADIAAKLAWIAEVGFTGSPRDHVSEGLRAFPYRGRCIYYRVFEDQVVIVRVLHGAQDIEQQDFDRP